MSFGEVSISINLVITIILLCGAGVSYLLLRKQRQKLADDPEYQKKLEEREKELRRQQQEEAALDAEMGVISSNDEDFTGDGE